MEINKQRRRFLSLSGLILSGLYIQGCSKDNGSESNKNNGLSLSSPVIITHPADQPVSEGTVAMFNVSANGDSLSYQWQRNGVDIPGATDSFYLTPPATQGDGGTVFTVTVINTNGSVTSNQAILVVNSISIKADSLVITVDSNLITTDTI